MRLVDIHPHIISADTARYPISPLGGKRSGWSIERPIDFAQLVAGMDRAGVDKAAIVHSSTTYGYDNSYVADSIAGRGERFVGVYSVDVLAPDAVQQIRAWMSRGMAGLRLFAAGSTVKSDQSWIADPVTYPAWDYCAANGISVAISMRQEGLPHLKQVVTRFPDVRVVLDHLLHTPMGDGPPYAAAAPLFEMTQYRNIYLKLTSAIVARTHDENATPATFFDKLLGAFGSSRIAWGSNYPAVSGTLPEIVAASKATLSILPQADQENIFWRTAVSLYPSLAYK